MQPDDLDDLHRESLHCENPQREDDFDVRLSADVELCEVLASCDFDGPLWEHYAEELAKYGCAVMSAWLRTGQITRECRRHGRPVDLPDHWTVDDQREVVLETVAKGLVVFRTALVDQRWSAKSGASLRTYFAGSCIRAFPNVLRAWSREQERWDRATQAWEQETALTDRQSPAESLAAIDAREALETMLADSPDRTKAILRLSFDGYTVAEIADVLVMTSATVSAVLHRSRVKARQDATLQEWSSR